MKRQLLKNEIEHIDLIVSCIHLEEKAQKEHFDALGSTSLKELRHAGLALHPLRIKRRSYGFADYPEFNFSLPYPNDSSNFRDGAQIEVFYPGEEAIKAILLGFDGRSGDVRLLGNDFPDWIEDGAALRLAPDTHTTEVMLRAMEKVRQQPVLNDLFTKIHADSSDETRPHQTSIKDVNWFNTGLNSSQKLAIKEILGAPDLMVVHGPPGTGKTTTLVEAVQQLAAQGKRVLVCAPGNAAVDHFAKSLLGKVKRMVRIGNNARIDESLFPYTIEGILKDSDQAKEIKKMKIRAEELRKMAHQYKRHFGKDERDQRKLLMNEVREIRAYIRKSREHEERSAIENAQVILGTPVGIWDAFIPDWSLDVVIIDEAGQCLEPLAWAVLSKADHRVLAGDHLQLPPTVISEEAQKKGFNRSVLETACSAIPNVFLLDTQYRMRRTIAGFSSKQFYDNKLVTPDSLADEGEHFLFYDTAGAGFHEETSEERPGYANSGEMNLVVQLIEKLEINCSKAAFISPYSSQIALAKETLPSELRCSTIDSFQGQEMHTIIISLVRSNDKGQVGFLSDHRRINVAMTRAKERLIVVGDSATLCSDTFFSSLIEYSENNQAYHSCFEVMY
jgi:ATP-dependent RNA/DNA helicase IGHMBP2